MFRLLSELEISFTQMKVLFVLERTAELALKDLAGAALDVAPRDVPAASTGS